MPDATPTVTARASADTTVPPGTRASTSHVCTLRCAHLHALPRANECQTLHARMPHIMVGCFINRTRSMPPADLAPSLPASLQQMPQRWQAHAQMTMHGRSQWVQSASASPSSMQSSHPSSPHLQTSGHPTFPPSCSLYGSQALASSPFVSHSKPLAMVTLPHGQPSWPALHSSSVPHWLSCQACEVGKRRSHCLYILTLATTAKRRCKQAVGTPSRLEEPRAV